MFRDQPVSTLKGVGKVTNDRLHACGIFTVGQLADASLPTTGYIVNNIESLISAAKVRIASTTPKEKEETVHTKKEFQWQIETHSWFEKIVYVPDPTADNALRKAVVYELNLESSHRVSFLCVWVSMDSLTSMTFSPPVLVHFNPSLPVLRVWLNPLDAQQMTNKNVLDNVIWESNVMLMFSQP
jgi:hypothetical protein